MASEKNDPLTRSRRSKSRSRSTARFFAFTSGQGSRCRRARWHCANIVRHPGAVTIVPLLPNGHVVLERQFRYPLGRIDDRISGRQDRRRRDRRSTCAQRELLEETGYSAAQWSPPRRFAQRVRYCDEKIEIFLARDLTHDTAKLDAGEVIESSPRHGRRCRSGFATARSPTSRRSSASCGWKSGSTASGRLRPHAPAALHIRALHIRASHVRIVRPAAALRHHPDDVLRRILDVAGLAVHAVLEIDLQPLLAVVAP